MKSMLKSTGLLMLLGLFVFVSCKKDEEPTPAGDPIATFDIQISNDNFLVVTFDPTGTQNADTYAWTFGDQNVSTEANPTHTYATAGTYTATLQVFNADGDASNVFSKEFTLTDPGEALRLLTGEVSKTWKLYREGTAMSVGTVENPGSGWPGFTNDGSRPCLYQQEFTFHADGTYTFDDKGVFWAEYGIFNGGVAATGCDSNTTPEGCMDVTGGTLVNECGDDVSTWLSGSHTFEYDPASGDLLLKGNGAWIGIPKLDNVTGYNVKPIDQVSATIASITENDGFDVMKVEFLIGAEYWPIYYANYTTATEPAIVTDGPPPFECTDLTDLAVTAMGHTFETATSFTQELGSVDTGASTIEVGAADPAGGATPVGKFTRVADVAFQEAKIQTSPAVKDFDLSGASTISLDVYFPSSNDYSGSLTKVVALGFADPSCIEQWWTDLNQWVTDGNHPEDQWVTLTYNLDDVAAGNPKARAGLDMIFINIGSGNHTTSGTFYIRNLEVK